MRSVQKISLVLAVFFILQTFAVYLFIKEKALKDINLTLDSFHERIASDLIYKNGTWDTTLYNADPDTPHPHGSSGFTTPLYIITDDGFIIERSQPIDGVLDSGDFKHLLTFQTPQTIAIVTNDQWRVYSQPIKDAKQEIVGVVTVAQYNPENILLVEIDQRLEENLSKITSRIQIRGNSIDASRVDIRKVRYDVAFTIVNKFNKVILSSGRTPSFIDPSYVSQELQRTNTTRIVIDKRRNKTFLMKTYPIINGDKTLGVIVVGNSMDFLDTLLKQYVIVSLALGAIVIIPIVFLLRKLIKRMLLYKFSKDEIETSQLPHMVSFDSKKSVIIIDGAKVSIPYATNQYTLCKAIFSFPNKRWEVDQLSERFGEMENQDAWRKVYDAALALNKKVGFKLVEYKDKTFRLNPSLSIKNTEKSS